MNLKTVRYSGFSRGMNDAAAVSDDFGRDECKLMLNVRPDYDGGAVTRGGTRVMTATSPLSGTYAQVVAYTPASGPAQLVRFVDGSVAYSTDDGANYTAIATGLTPGWWDFATMRVGTTNYLLAVNGSHAKKWDGATWGDIANIPAGVRYLAVHNSRLWAAGHSGNVTVASKIGDFETWATPDGLTLQINTGDGDEAVRGLFSFGPSLLAFKRRSVASISGVGESDLIVGTGWQGVSRSVGLLSFRTLQAAGDQGVCWQSDRGVEFYDGQAVRLLSERLRTFLATVDREASVTGTSWGLYYPERNEYWLSVPTSTYGDGREWAGVNLSTGACFRLRRRTAFQAACMAVTAFGGSRQRPVGYDTSGNTQLLEYAEMDDSAFDIAGELHTALADFGGPAQSKRLRLVRLVGEGQDASVTVYAVADSTAGPAHTFTAASPFRKLVRVSRRGVNHSVQINLAGGQKITGVEMDAEILGGVR